MQLQSRRKRGVRRQNHQSHQSRQSRRRQRKRSLRDTTTTNTTNTLIGLQAFETDEEPRGEQDIERALVRLFKTPFTPTQFRAQDDYYTYINYQWLSAKTKELSDEANLKHYVQIDSFRVVQEKVYYELIDLVKQYLRTHTGPKAQAVRRVYSSLDRLEPAAAERAVAHLVQRLDRQRQAPDPAGLYAVLGDLNRNEVVSWGSPLVWNVLRDEKNVRRYKSTLSAPQLTVYDYLLYIEDTKDDVDTANYKRQFKRAYLAFLRQVFALCLGASEAESRTQAQHVWDCEMDLLTCMGDRDHWGKEDPDGHNVLSTAQAAALGLDWPALAAAIGYPADAVPASLICTSPNYLGAVMALLQTDAAWRSDKWRAYFLYVHLRQVMRFHREWRLAHYAFFGKFVEGQPVPYPRALYPVFGLSFCFNTLLTNEYIDRHPREAEVAYTRTLAADLLAVFRRIVRRNTWLSPRTKQAALRKLETIHLQVGSPKLMREDPVLEYSPTDAYQNMERLAEWRCRKMIRLDGQESEVDVPVIDWQQFKMVGKQSYVVNAYYTPTENSIYVPLAYLQPPFVDLAERGIEYNLAHIGFTLGHEMSHSLDDMGSKYDERGNLHNWWTEADRRRFQAKVRDVARQYETFAAYDGIQMDAMLSTGENLADISGLAICEEYLRDFQEKNEDIVPIRALSFHAFFVYIAVQARQKIFDAAIKAQLKTNPHPMDKYRTNCPLSRLKLFRSLYNVQPGDKMHWKTTDTIW